MVLLTGLDSIIESLYIEDSLTEHPNKSNIIVNPINVTYVTNRIVIINKKWYPKDNIEQLLNSNTVISRFDVGIDGVIIDPYQLRLNDKIQCNNEIVNIVNENLFESIDHKFDGEYLYYPKSISFYDHCYNSELTVIGYLMYQLGGNISDVKTPNFKNLDIIKSSKRLY